MLEVNQPWDPLKVCAVGRSYPPEFYHWIGKSHVRHLFEKIAYETEEDYQKLITVLEQFGVHIVRPDASYNIDAIKHEMPPMCPRDHMIMIGSRFYYKSPVKWQDFYRDVKDASWPDSKSIDDLPDEIYQECSHQWHDPLITGHPGFKKIFQFVKDQKTPCIPSPFDQVNGAETTRIGKDLFFGTHSYIDDTKQISDLGKNFFPSHRTHVVNTGGHSDGTFCPVVPGLIVSLRDISSYKVTFPDWEVVYLPNQSWSKVKPFLELKKKNHGRWWIPGFEHDQDVIDLIENWLDHWTGYVEETVFDVNMLVVDQNNVIVFGYNDVVFRAFEKYNITPHIVPLRHRYFWDGGIHCVTSDLHRIGKIKDFFPNN